MSTTNEASRFALLTPTPACLHRSQDTCFRFAACSAPPRDCLEVFCLLRPTRGHNMDTLRDFVVVFDGSPGDSAPPENTCCRGVAFPRHFNLIGAFPPNLPLPDSAPPLHTAETASGRRRSLTQLHQSACCATSKYGKWHGHAPNGRADHWKKVIMKRKVSRQPSRSPRKGSRHAA